MFVRVVDLLCPVMALDGKGKVGCCVSCVWGGDRAERECVRVFGDEVLLGWEGHSRLRARRVCGDVSSV